MKRTRLVKRSAIGMSLLSWLWGFYGALDTAMSIPQNWRDVGDFLSAPSRGLPSAAIIFSLVFLVYAFWPEKFGEQLPNTIASANANGDRSVAVAGDVYAPISTGDVINGKLPYQLTEGDIDRTIAKVGHGPIKLISVGDAEIAATLASKLESRGVIISSKRHSSSGSVAVSSSIKTGPLMVHSLGDIFLVVLNTTL